MSNEQKRVGIYGRVSTVEQHVENQVSELKRYAAARGWNVVAELTDKGYSGSRDRRPGLDELMVLARKRRIDTVLVWKFDRFARSVKHLVTALDEFRDLGVDFVSFTEAFDTSTPSGKMLFSVVGAVAEFERCLLKERIMAGLNRARSLGRHLGRPRLEVNVKEVQRLHGQGQSLRQIATAMKISRNSAWRALSLNQGRI